MNIQCIRIIVIRITSLFFSPLNPLSTPLHMLTIQMLSVAMRLLVVKLSVCSRHVTDVIFWEFLPGDGLQMWRLAEIPPLSPPD